MSKRGNSEGTIRKRPDGRWEARISLPGGGRKSLYGVTRAEVAQKLTALQRDLDRGLPVPDDRLTVGQFLDRWLEASVKPSVRPRTYESYAGHVHRHLKPALGQIPLSRLSPAQVQDFLNKRIESGLSPTTAISIRATLRRALNMAMRWELVVRNVATLIDPPKPGKFRARPWTPEEASAFLEAARGNRLEALYNLVMATGLRQGEALGLRWEDVDLDAGIFTVRHSLQSRGGKRFLTEPKTASSVRLLPLPAFVVRQLRDHRARQNRERLLAGEAWEDSGLVFTTRTGRPMEGTDVTKRFQKLTRQAGLPQIRFHDLRHTCGTFLLAKGVDLQVIKQVLGHTTIAVTSALYAHVTPALEHEAMHRMDELLGGER